MENVERKRIPERKKRYGWLLLITVLIWATIGAMIVFTDPENIANLVIPGSYLLFGLLLTIGIFLLLTIIFLSGKRALWWTVGVMIFVYLRLFGLGSWLNAVLIFGVLVCGELYVRFGKA